MRSSFYEFLKFMKKMILNCGGISFVVLAIVSCQSPGSAESPKEEISWKRELTVGNLSNDRDHFLMPVWAFQFAAVYLLLISVIGSILNMIVVVVLLSDQQKMTPLNWMLLNLAFCDGIISGFGTTISTTAAFHFGWPFSSELCVAYAMIISTAGIGSITTLSALAVYRCKLVVQKHVHPPNRTSAFTNHSVRLERRQAALLLALIWCYALAVTCPPLFEWGHYDLVAAHISCSVNWESKKNNNQLYIVYMFTMGLVIPMATIVVSYGNILRVIRKLKAEMATKNLRQKRNFQMKKTSRQSDAAEKRSTIMVAVMIGAFLIAWTPYSILALIETFDGVNVVPPVLATVPNLFAKTSAVFNPIIYGFLNTQFKLTWEKFSLRFIDRSGRSIGTSSDNEQSPPMQLIDSSLTADQSTRNLIQTITTVSPAVINGVQDERSDHCVVQKVGQDADQFGNAGSKTSHQFLNSSATSSSSRSTVVRGQT